MSPPPLHKLIEGNFSDSVALGLIDDSGGGGARFWNLQSANWESDLAENKQQEHFKKCMGDALAELDSLHRPLAAASARLRKIATVMTLRSFGRYYELQIASNASWLFLKSMTEVSVTIPDAWVEARNYCMRYSAQFGTTTGAGVFPSIDVKALGLTGSRKVWIAPPTRSGRKRASATNASQYWRDRLGLIYLSAPASPTMGDALVRLQFWVRPSKIKIDRTNWKSFCQNHPSELWLIRPTMVHEGNRRFAQGHDMDGPVSVGRKFGKTRDLDSPTHAAGEQEMLLICGDTAQIKFGGIELLEGIPAEVPTRDNSDAKFVANLSAERGWM